MLTLHVGHFMISTSSAAGCSLPFAKSKQEEDHHMYLIRTETEKDWAVSAAGGQYHDNHFDFYV